MLVVAGEQGGVQRVQLGGIHLLQRSPPDGTSGDVQADVAPVGLERPRLDGVLDGRQPDVVEER